MSTSGDNPASRSRTAEQQVRPLQFQVACPGETARRQRVDASDRFFAVCKLALAFTRGHVRANQEVDQALVHLVGCLLALALVPLRCLLPKNALTVLSVRVRPMYLWGSERAPYNHPPLFFVTVPPPFPRYGPCFAVL